MSLTVQPAPELRDTKLRFHFGEYSLGRIAIHAAVFSPVFRGADTEEIESGTVSEALKVYQRPVAVLGQPAAHIHSGARWHNSRIEYVPEVYPRYYVNLNGSFEEYLKLRSPKHRKNLRWSANKLAEHCNGTQHTREYRTASEIADFHVSARRVSELTYQHRLLGAGIPITEEFRTKLQNLASQDRARGYVLFHGDRPIAFSFVSLRERAATFEMTGFDPAPEYKKFSIGTIVLLETLERLFAEKRYATLDFGAGEAWYKSSFSSATVQCCDLYVFPPKIKFAAIIAAHGFTRGASHVSVRLLKALKVQDAVKKFLRSRS